MNLRYTLQIQMSLKQGCSLSCTLFGLNIGKVSNYIVRLGGSSSMLGRASNIKICLSILIKREEWSLIPYGYSKGMPISTILFQSSLHGTVLKAFSKSTKQYSVFPCSRLSFIIILNVIKWSTMESFGLLLAQMLICFYFSAQSLNSVPTFLLHWEELVSQVYQIATV